MKMNDTGRWPNIEATLSERLVTEDTESMLAKRWSNVVEGGLTVNQHWFNVMCLLGGQQLLSSLLGEQHTFVIVTKSESCIWLHNEVTQTGQDVAMVQPGFIITISMAQLIPCRG